MLKDPSFYVLLALLSAGATSGLMVAANAAPIGQSMFGLSAAVAAIYVGFYSISNAAGRFLWGAVSDRLGRLNALLCIFILVAAMLVVLTVVRTPIGFLVGMLGVGVSFGGIMGVFPSLCMERYGQKTFGVNYGILFGGYSIAAIFGPRLGASIGHAHDGDFTLAFLIAAAISLAGAGVTLWFKWATRRADQEHHVGLAARPR